MVSAICPNCHITLMEAASGANASVFTAVATANRLGAKFVSMSWGGAELAGNEPGHDWTAPTSRRPASSTPPRPVTTATPTA